MPSTSLESFLHELCSKYPFVDPGTIQNQQSTLVKIRQCEYTSNGSQNILEEETISYVA